MQEEIEIEKAKKEDIPSILELMKDAGLTAEGLEDAELWIMRKNGKVSGSIGLELWGKQGLLRSLVIAKNERSTGLGSALVLYIIEQARQSGVNELYLLTDQVGAYYLRFGFEYFERKKVSGDVLQSSEFRGACLETAPVMRIKLGN